MCILVQVGGSDLSLEEPRLSGNVSGGPLKKNAVFKVAFLLDNKALFKCLQHVIPYPKVCESKLILKVTDWRTPYS